MANKNPNPATRFKPGEKPPGNGRPKGSRDKLTAAFIGDLTAAWERDGAKVLRTLARDDPATFARVTASIVPKELEIIDPLRSLSDDKLSAAIETLTDMLRAKVPKPKDEPRPTVN